MKDKFFKFMKSAFFKWLLKLAVKQLKNDMHVSLFKDKVDVKWDASKTDLILGIESKKGKEYSITIDL